VSVSADNAQKFSTPSFKGFAINTDFMINDKKKKMKINQFKENTVFLKILLRS